MSNTFIALLSGVILGFAGGLFVSAIVMRTTEKKTPPKRNYSNKVDWLLSLDEQKLS